jgi:hypothetical protein
MHAVILNTIWNNELLEMWLSMFPSFAVVVFYYEHFKTTNL